MLIRTNKRILGHPIMKTLTDTKWDLFAEKIFYVQITLMLLYNLFWTLKYLQRTNSSGEVGQEVVGYMFVVVGYAIISVHVTFTLFMAHREYAATVKLEASLERIRKAEKRLSHRLMAEHSSKLFEHDKSWDFRRRLRRLGLDMVLVSLVTDLVLVYLTTLKLYSILHHQSEEFNEMFVRCKLP